MLVVPFTTHCIQLPREGEGEVAAGNLKEKAAVFKRVEGGGAAFTQWGDALLQGGENASLSYSLLQIALWIQEHKGFNSLAAQTVPLPLIHRLSQDSLKQVLPFGLGEGGVSLFYLLLLLYLCLVFSKHPSLNFSKQFCDGL